MRATNRFSTSRRLAAVLLTGLLLSASGARAQVLPINITVPTIRSNIGEVVYYGAKHFESKELDELTGLKRGDPLIPWKNQRACQLILERYYEQGRVLATVRLLEGGKPTESRVAFDITEGPKFKIRSIEYTGNKFVSDVVLKTHRKAGTDSGKFNPLIADCDVTNLEEYYRSCGFLDVKVAREMRWVDDNHVDLVFHVHEGLRYRVGSRPQVDGAGKEIPQETIEAIPHMKPVDSSSGPQIERDIKAITDYYTYVGRDAKVRPMVNSPADNPNESPTPCFPFVRDNK